MSPGVAAPKVAPQIEVCSRRTEQQKVLDPVATLVSWKLGLPWLLGNCVVQPVVQHFQVVVSCHLAGAGSSAAN